MRGIFRFILKDKYIEMNLDSKAKGFDLITDKTKLTIKSVESFHSISSKSTQ